MITSNSNGDTTFALFWLYRVRPQWRQVPQRERARMREEVARTLEERKGPLTLRGAYSLVGLRADADLMLWLHGPSLEEAQARAVALRKTALGAYLEQVYAYLGVVAPSGYAPAHRPAFTQGEPPRAYLCMYPFTKTPEWYLLPFERRRAMMAEHGRLGAVHSALPEGRSAVESEGKSGAAVAVAAPQVIAPLGRVLANTVHAFGLGDQEFVVAFEAEDPVAIARMVEELRAAEVRRYTAADTPIFLGRRKDLRAVLDDLG